MKKTLVRALSVVFLLSLIPLLASAQIANPPVGPKVPPGVKPLNRNCTQAPSCIGPVYKLSNAPCPPGVRGQCYVCSVSKELREAAFCPRGFDQPLGAIEGNNGQLVNGVYWYFNDVGIDDIDGGGYSCTSVCVHRCDVRFPQHLVMGNADQAGFDNCVDQCPPTPQDCPVGFVYRPALVEADSPKIDPLEYYCDFKRDQKDICGQCGSDLMRVENATGNAICRVD